MRLNRHGGGIRSHRNHRKHGNIRSASVAGVTLGSVTSYISAYVAGVTLGSVTSYIGASVAGVTLGSVTSYISHSDLLHWRIQLNETI